MSPNPRPISQQSSQSLNQGIDYLLEQYPGRIRYLDAQNLINESKRKLGMSRIELWNEQLRQECDRRMLQLSISSSAASRSSLHHERKQQQHHHHQPNKTGTPDITTQAQNSEATSQTPTEWSITHQPSLRREMMEKRTFSLCVKPAAVVNRTSSALLGMTPRANDSETSSPAASSTNKTKNVENSKDTSTANEKDVEFTESGGTSIHVKSAHSVGDAYMRAGCVRQRKYEIVQVDEQVFDSDDDDDEFAGDDCSQNTDHSKCFTTLKELARDDPKAYEKNNNSENNNPCEYEDVDEDDDHAVAVDKFYDNYVPMKRYGDSSTVGTGDESEPGIPMLITIRWRDPPEVPNHEQLGECYLVPIPIRSRSEKFRRQVFKKILRFTGRSYQAERIEDDDSEAYKQTLVEL